MTSPMDPPPDADIPAETSPARPGPPFVEPEGPNSTAPISTAELSVSGDPLVRDTFPPSETEDP